MGVVMAPMKAMKAMKAMKKAATKSETIGALEATSGVAKKEVSAILGALETEAVAQLKKAGKFVIPGVTMIKLRHKPATKAGTRNVFGKLTKVKAKPAKTVVKSFAVKALKD